MKPKSIFLSKTFWASIVTMVIGVVSETTNLVPTNWQGSLLFCVGVLNCLLRWMTVQPVVVPLAPVKEMMKGGDGKP